MKSIPQLQFSCKSVLFEPEEEKKLCVKVFLIISKCSAILMLKRPNKCYAWFFRSIWLTNWTIQPVLLLFKVLLNLRMTNWMDGWFLTYISSGIMMSHLPKVLGTTLCSYIHIIRSRGTNYWLCNTWIVGSKSDWTNSSEWLPLQ